MIFWQLSKNISEKERYDSVMTCLQREGGEGGGGEERVTGYTSKRVNTSWRAKDSSGLQAKFHR